MTVDDVLCDDFLLLRCFNCVSLHSAQFTVECAITISLSLPAAATSLAVQDQSSSCGQRPLGPNINPLTSAFYSMHT